MNITPLRQPITTVEAQWLIVGLFENEMEVPEGLSGTAPGATIERLRAEKELTGALGELTPLFEPAGLPAGALLLVGLGPRREFDAGAAFSAGFTAAKRLAGRNRDGVAVVLPAADDPPSMASALIEGMIVGTRSAGLRKT